MHTHTCAHTDADTETYTHTQTNSHTNTCTHTHHPPPPHPSPSVAPAAGVPMPPEDPLVIPPTKDTVHHKSTLPSRSPVNRHVRSLVVFSRCPGNTSFLFGLVSRVFLSFLSGLLWSGAARSLHPPLGPGVLSVWGDLPLVVGRPQPCLVLCPLRHVRHMTPVPSSPATRRGVQHCHLVPCVSQTPAESPFLP